MATKERILAVLSDRAAKTFPAEVAPYVMKPREYLTRPEQFAERRVRVINLASNISYMGTGYYASLLAGARGHRVIPTINQLTTLDRKRLWQPSVGDIEALLNADLDRVSPQPVSPSRVFMTFGRTDDPRFKRVARALFERFRVPLLVFTIAFHKKKGWCFDDLEPVSAQNLDAAEEKAFKDALVRFLKTDWRPPKLQKNAKWTLAVLHDPTEEMPASDDVALRRLSRVGKRMNVDVKIITKDDYSRLGEYDALFIRATTNVDHHTFRFATRAEGLGMPVIYDPMSILRCTNKVFLAEALRTHRIPSPKTMVLDRRTLAEAPGTLGFPMILKIPDGAFSRGIVKVTNAADLDREADILLKESDLIIAQEFLPTTFDWRLGVLHGQALYACQYFMTRNHWQIYKHVGNGKVKSGGFKTFAIADVPADVVDVGVKAANLMGDGLYGVDLKQSDKGVFVIEVNDNPSIDGGIEDAHLKDKLYEQILGEFRARLAL
ncbi:MAG: RimK family protein [Proteobacteria bacterium]|nr:RimK family protein [Pseudomonadota bacterium]